MMKFQFSENIWEKIASLGNEENEDVLVELDYSDKQVRYLMKVWFLVRRAAKSERRSCWQVQRAWQQVDIRTRQRSVRPFILAFRYAAIFIVMVGLFVMWLKHTEPTPLPVVDSVGFISSGTRKAELTLSNGEKIVLDTNLYHEKIEVAGMNFVNDERKGELRYRGISVKGEFCRDVYHTLYVPQGGEYVLQLPDGSQVWLNSETTVRFPVSFGKKREIFLCGEAYFKVVKNDSLPFRVNLTEGNITVLGTCFNVSAYEDDGIWQTTLVEGSVGLEDKQKKILLKPNEQYSVNRKTGERMLKKVDTELYTSWTNGKFYFSAYAFEEIVKKLERWYDFIMIYQDEEIKKMHFSGTIDKHRPLNEVLYFLEKTADIHFEISGKNITVGKIKKGQES